MDYTQGPPPPPAPAPPPYAAPPPPRKGLPALAWAGIGCGGLVIVCLVAGALLMVRLGKTAMSVLNAHPAQDAVETLVEKLPDYEKVSEDTEKGSITLRSKVTGESIATDYDSLVMGRTKVKDAAGALVPIAGGDLTKIPPWVPRYAGATGELMLVQRDDASETSGVFSFTSNDAPNLVTDFYGAEAGKLGMGSNYNGSTELGNRISRSFHFRSGGRLLEVHAFGTGGPPWIVEVMYKGK